MKKTLFALCALFIVASLQAQKNNYDIVGLNDYKIESQRRIIRIPDILGFQTLKCEFHSHTIYSDGHILPGSRVEEAWMDGLDAIAITDHLGSRPFKEMDDNTSYNIAKTYADRIGMMLIRGTELTYSEPTGHLNAFFIKDADVIYKTQKTGRENHPENYVKGVEEAVNQGAFVVINHPGWPDNESTLHPHQIEFIKKGWIQGVEMFNDGEYYPKTMDDIVKYNLTPIAATDVHGTTYHSYRGAIRPMTLVLAKERSLDAIKEALIARRTIGFFGGNLFGKKEYVTALFKASVSLKEVSTDKNGKKTYEITNSSDIPFHLENAPKEYIWLNPNSAARFAHDPKDGPLQFTVKNIFLSSKDHLEVSLPF